MRKHSLKAGLRPKSRVGGGGDDRTIDPGISRDVTFQIHRIYYRHLNNKIFWVRSLEPIYSILCGDLTATMSHVTAVRTVTRGYSDDGTLGGQGLGIQTTQSAGGGLLRESRVKLLRTFSTVKVPFPRPFSIMMSSNTLF